MWKILLLTMQTHIPTQETRAAELEPGAPEPAIVCGAGAVFLNLAGVGAGG